MARLVTRIIGIEAQLVTRTFRALKNADEKTTLDMFCSLLKLEMWADVGDDLSAKVIVTKSYIKNVVYMQELEDLRLRYVLDTAKKLNEQQSEWEQWYEHPPAMRKLPALREGVSAWLASEVVTIVINKEASTVASLYQTYGERNEEDL